MLNLNISPIDQDFWWLQSRVPGCYHPSEQPCFVKPWVITNRSKNPFEAAAPKHKHLYPCILTHNFPECPPLPSSSSHYFIWVPEIFAFPLSSPPPQQLWVLRGAGRLPQIKADVSITVFAVMKARALRASEASPGQEFTANRWGVALPLLSVILSEPPQIGGNLKTMIRVFRLFDYNRGGHIQRHEFRRILDNYCIPLTEREFQRYIWYSLYIQLLP